MTAKTSSRTSAPFARTLAVLASGGVTGCSIVAASVTRSPVHGATTVGRPGPVCQQRPARSPRGRVALLGGQCLDLQGRVLDAVALTERGPGRGQHDLGVGPHPQH